MAIYVMWVQACDEQKTRESDVIYVPSDSHVSS